MKIPGIGNTLGAYLPSTPNFGPPLPDKFHIRWPSPIYYQISYTGPISKVGLKIAKLEDKVIQGVKLF